MINLIGQASIKVETISLSEKFLVLKFRFCIFITVTLFCRHFSVSEAACMAIGSFVGKAILH